MILYPVLLMVKQESRCMWRISLWPFSSDCISSILQFSVCITRFRFAIHLRSSFWIWETFPSPWELLWQAWRGSWYL
jgi:hypothetical protein